MVTDRIALLDAVTAHRDVLKDALIELGLDGSEQPDRRIAQLIKFFGYELCRVSELSPLLYGCGANVDGDAHVIWISKGFDGTKQREILAHELAHIILGHGDVSGYSVTGQRDWSFYGQTERCERLADNLAAFILITDEAVAACCKEARTWDGACEQLGVVSDVLLRRLSQMHTGIDYSNTRPLHTLTADLQQIVDTPNNVRVMGSTGTGKSEILLQRLLKFSQAKGILHSRLLFVTFQRRLMMQLWERLTAYDAKIAERVTFTTVHEYAADILLRNWQQLGWKKVPIVVGIGEISQVLNQWVGTFDENDRDRLLHSFGQYPKSATYCGDFEALHTKISSRLYELGYVYQASICTLAWHAIQEPNRLYDESLRWDAVLVDEIQQLTNDELGLLEAISSRACFGLTVAGTDQATLYAFRGAVGPSCMDWNVTPPFTEFVLDISKRIRKTPTVTLKRIPRNSSILDSILNSKSCRSLNGQERMFVCLRHNSLVKEVAQGLEDRGISVRRSPMQELESLNYLDPKSENGIHNTLDWWWTAFRRESAGDLAIDPLTLSRVLINIDAWQRHSVALHRLGLTCQTLREYLTEVRAHHQHLDMYLSKGLSVRTLHSVDGDEIDHIVIPYVDELIKAKGTASDSETKPSAPDKDGVALLRLAISRATTSILLFYTEIESEKEIARAIVNCGFK